MVATPVPDVGFHPGRTLDHTAPGTDTAVELDVGLEYFLFVAVTFDVEVLPVFLTGNEGVFARVDDFLESSLSSTVVFEEEESLALKSICKALGNLNGTVFVGSALALVKISCSSLALLGDPLVEVLVRHRVLRILVSVVRQTVSDHVIDERRSVPHRSEEEVDVCTHYAGLSYNPLGGSSLAAFGQTVLEVVDNEVAGVVNLEQVVVEVVYYLVTRIVAELVDLGHEVIVAEVGTSGISIISHVVEGSLVVSIDRTTVLSCDAGSEPCVSSSQGGLCVSIGLVESLISRNTFLRDVKKRLAAGSEREQSGDGENRV